ncbi:hypothetical protein [Thiofaba sp. EF100]|uniref:hypothetical protein n=1 Tax=Thiofaba sp. EF100 TaxID=3121274 RepID=UPI0032217A7B
MNTCREEMQAIMLISRELRQAMDDEAEPLERIESLVAEREERIRRFFSSPIESELRAEVAAWIQDLMIMDRKAMQALALRRQKMQEQHAVMRHQARGLAEYQQTGEMGE